MLTADAVVIGAGHNGLVAANLLADAGWDVVVCEAASRAGGAVATAEVTAPGFANDLYSAFYPLAAASPVLRELDLAAHGLTWSHAPAVLSHLLPDGRSATIWRDRDRTAESLEAFHPGDGAAWLQLVAQWEAVGASVIDGLLRPFPPVRAAAGLLRRAGTAETMRIARLAVLTARRFGTETFGGDGGRALVAGNALHGDIPPDGAGSALYGWLLCMLGQQYGFPVPVGGAAAIVDALVARLHAAGGALRLSARVESVEMRGGRACGVVLDGGERVAARRAVLADVDASLLYLRLVGEHHLPSRVVGDLGRLDPDPATLKIDWALTRPVPWPDDDTRHAGTVHLGGDLNDLTDYAADLATGRVPQRPFLLFGQMTIADATRSPAGTEAAWAYTHLPRERRGADSNAEDVERVEAVIEHYAPGFRASVRGRHVQDLDAGAVNGGTAQLHQQLVFRPTPGLGGADTPIDRLYLAGSSAHPGGGVHGACGANAARLALRRDTLGGLRHRARSTLLRRIQQ